MEHGPRGVVHELNPSMVCYPRGLYGCVLWGDRLPMKRVLKRHIGEMVRIEFLDNSSGHETPVPPVVCTVYGRVKAVEKDIVTIYTWEIDTDDPDMKDSNETFNIVQVAIRRVEILTERD